MLPDHRMFRLFCMPLGALILAAAPCVAQNLKPPRLLTDAESKSLHQAHSSGADSTAATFKYHHSVLEMTMGQGLISRVETFAMIPDKVLIVTTMPVLGSSETGYDGKICWSVSPMTGPVLLEGAPLKLACALVSSTVRFPAPGRIASRF